MKYETQLLNGKEESLGPIEIEFDIPSVMKEAQYRAKMRKLGYVNSATERTKRMLALSDEDWDSDTLEADLKLHECDEKDFVAWEELQAWPVSVAIECITSFKHNGFDTEPRGDAKFFVCLSELGNALLVGGAHKLNEHTENAPKPEAT